MSSSSPAQHITNSAASGTASAPMSASGSHSASSTGAPSYYNNNNNNAAPASPSSGLVFPGSVPRRPSRDALYQPHSQQHVYSHSHSHHNSRPVEGGEEEQEALAIRDASPSPSLSPSPHRRSPSPGPSASAAASHHSAPPSRQRSMDGQQYHPHPHAGAGGQSPYAGGATGDAGSSARSQLLRKTTSSSSLSAQSASGGAGAGATAASMSGSGYYFQQQPYHLAQSEGISPGSSTVALESRAYQNTSNGDGNGSANPDDISAAAGLGSIPESRYSGLHDSQYPDLDRDHASGTAQAHDPSTRRTSVAIGSGIGIGGVPALEERVALEQYAPPPASHTQSQQDDTNGGGDYGFGPTAPSVPEGFDEGALKALCDMDCGMPLLLDRMKQSMASAQEAAVFFKKRAQIEEDYARAMTKLARSSSQSYSVSEGKAGSYVSSWLSLLRTHELLGDNRLKLAAQLAEISDELTNLGKEVDKSRKTTKELGTKLERGLSEQEGLVDKARSRFDNAAEELERLLILKTGESIKDTAISHAASNTSSSNLSSGGGGGGGSSINGSGGTGSGPVNKRSFGKAMSKLKGPKNPAQVAKQEEEVRSRMGQCSDAYRSQVLGAQAVRQEYFNLQLPRLLRTMKESADETDLGTQYHLSRYAYIFESTLVTDGLTISPLNSDDGPGLKTVVDAIDVREDFKTFMQQYAVSWQMSGQKGPRRDGPAEEGYLTQQRPPLSPRASTSSSQPYHQSASSHHPHHSHSHPQPTFSRPTFGVDLGDQMQRDGVEVPRVLEKCCEAIEMFGLDSMGIYRLSGTTSRVQRLKSALDRDVEGTDLMSEENLSDINDIAAVMKLWFRELPEPLLTWELYHGFIEAAKIENDRLRHIRLHERVNDLPDPNYATLKYLMGHLDKVKQRESINQMTGSNLAIVFGPNLLGQPPAQYYTNGQGPGGQATNSQTGTGTALADMQWQCKVIETILHHYAEIFLDDA